MRSIVLLSEKPVDLVRLSADLRGLADCEAHLTSAACLVIARRDDLVTVLADDEILNDYDGSELEARGVDWMRVHLAALSFRRLALLKEVLMLCRPRLGAAWLDDDHGVILPVDEALADFTGFVASA